MRTKNPLKHIATQPWSDCYTSTIFRKRPCRVWRTEIPETWLKPGWLYISWVFVSFFNFYFQRNSPSFLPGHTCKHKPTSCLISPLVYPASQWTTSPTLGTHIKSSWCSPKTTRFRMVGILSKHPTKSLTPEINSRSERILTGVERFLGWHSKDQSGIGRNACFRLWDMVERYRDGEEWIVLERWWVDHRLRTVVICVDEHEHEYARKGYGKWKANKGGTVFSEEDREYLLLLLAIRYWMRFSFF